MNRVNTRQSRPEKPAGEPLDALLGAFFRAEMPSPWPAFHRPARTRLSFDQARAARRPAYAGRLALAASVGLLFVGSWLLPSVVAPRAPRGESLPTLGPASASKGGLPRINLPAEKPGTNAPDKVKSSLYLEQGSDGRTGVKITVEEVLPPK
jgi:hypothetical protein